MGAAITMAAGALIEWGIGSTILTAGAAAIAAPLIIGGALAVYQAYTRSSSQYEQKSREYDSIKQAYQIQEGIYNPAKTRMANLAQGVGHAVAPVVGASAAIGISADPHEVATGIGEIAAGFDSSSIASDRTPTSNENAPWHPAQDRKSGHSFAKAEEIRRQSNVASQHQNYGV